MITRRKLLAFLGLGGAAAAVASKVEALGETNGAIEHVEYAGPMLEDMPPVTLYASNSGAGPSFYDNVPLFTPDYERRIFGIVESVEPDGKAWVRIGGR